MKLEEFGQLTDKIKAMSDEAFWPLYGFVRNEANRRELYPQSPPKSPQGGELKDCDPGSKRQGAAPNYPLE